MRLKGTLEIAVRSRPKPAQRLQYYVQGTTQPQNDTLHSGQDPVRRTSTQKYISGQKDCNNNGADNATRTLRKPRYGKLLHPLEYNRNKREAIPDNNIQKFRAETTCYHTHCYETARRHNQKNEATIRDTHLKLLNSEAPSKTSLYNLKRF